MIMVGTSFLAPGPPMIVLELLRNMALLLAMVAGYRVLLNRWDWTIREQAVLSGFVFGGVAIAGMVTPVQLAGGMILDGRSVVLALAGTYGGPVVAAIAACMAIGVRIALGGAGTLVGVFSVIAAAAGGVVVFRRWTPSRTVPSLTELWALGIAVHLAMAVAFLGLLRGPGAPLVDDAIALLLMVYPPVTVLAALLFSDYEVQRLDRAKLAAQVVRNEALWDSMADGVLVLDEVGRLTLLNPSGERLLGVRADAVRGGSIHDLLHLVDARGQSVSPAALVADPADDRGREFDPGEEVRLVTAEGRSVPVEVVSRAVRRSGGGRQGVLVAIRDRTREHDAWQAAREAEERRELALDGGGLGTWDWNIATGRVVYDQRWANMLGYRVDELGDTIEEWGEMVHPDDRADVEAAVVRHLADPEGAPYDVRIRLRHGEGGWRWILGRGRVVEWDADGTPVRMAGIQSDITELVKAQDDLRESEARFRRLVENAPDLVFRYRFRPEPGFDFVSPSSTAIVGYTPEEHYADPALGRRIVHPDDLHLVTEVDGGAEPRQPLRLRWIHKDGHVVWTEQHAVRIFDDAGELVAIEGIARDVTDRHRAEEKIRRMARDLEGEVRVRTAELRRANQELEAFSYSVSHDLKAPLRAIDGYSALLQHDAGELSPETLQLVAEVRRNTALMGDLIDGLLTFSRVGRAELVRRPVEVGGMIREMVEAERVRHPDHPIELVMGEVPPIEGDPILLRQALANVVGNAVKFSTSRSRTRLEITAAEVGSSIRLGVVDNGVGFDSRYAHKLFRVFERLHHDDEFPGSGVGLATVKRIVDRHGGRVHIDSELGVGTSVHLFLPRAEGAPTTTVADVSCAAAVP